ncbi:2-oxo acid dehydrogenase subunit E2 [Deefgea piscis]|uniref:2-oxo acid dehydrogenase subunit E2 n=1 Tax=Deefgea piscis TaxID=2739061 RepID=UPI001C825A16|nr:2-oxo acid dehydrogenase subunit E2 [Deefgea piscis]QZA81258.1 2-oxo acid dehydrogenase subunit E2 [Deefgea piscis]
MAKYSLIFRQLITELLAAKAPAIEQKIPVERHLIEDILREGRRKNNIHLVSEFCSDTAQQYRKEHGISLTSWIAKGLACAIHEDLAIQSSLRGKSTRVIFQDVDIAVMIERQLADQSYQPLHYIIRNAGSKSLAQIQAELSQAKTGEIGNGGPLTALELAFFKLPSWLRKPVWWWLRYDPYSRKQMLGTVGITSNGMFAKGAAVILPISPLSLSLSIGGASQRIVASGEQFKTSEYIQLNLTADHDVTDGAPLMRFATRLTTILEQGHSELR